MKRRSFLGRIAAAVGAAFVAREAEAEYPDFYEWCGIKPLNFNRDPDLDWVECVQCSGCEVCVPGFERRSA